MTIQLLVGGLIAIIPFLHVLSPSGLSAHNFARAAELLLLLAVALGGLLRRRSCALPAVRALQAGFLALAATLLALSTAMARQPLFALREVALWLGLAVLVLVMCQSLRHQGSRPLLACLALGVACYNTVYLLLLSWAWAGGQPIQVWELVFGFDNPRFLNHCQTVALPLVVLVLVQPGWSRALRWVAGFASVSTAMLAALTVARATGLAWLLALLLGVCVAPRSGRAFLTSLLWTLVLGAGLALVCNLLVPGLGYTQGYDANTRELSSAHSRDYLWRLAWTMAREAPWLGVGPLHFADVHNLKGAHPHNMYLLVMAENGLPFAVLMVLGMVFGLWRMAMLLRQSPHVDVLRGTGLWVALMAMAVDAGFSGNSVMPLSQLWGCMALAMTCAWWPRAHTEQAPHAAAWPLRVLPAIVMVVLVWVSAWELTAPVPSIGQQVKPGQSGEMRPRFWSHGWIGP